MILGSDVPIFLNVHILVDINGTIWLEVKIEGNKPNYSTEK